MKPSPAPSRFRLIDGVILAAIALLGLKTLGIMAGHPDRGDGGVASSFGRVIAHARTNFEPSDPVTTGSVTPAAKEAAPPPAGDTKPGPRSAIPASVPATEQTILDRMGERRQELQERAREVAERQKLIEEQERKLEERLGRLQAIEDEKKNAAGAKSEAEAASLKGVVVMYESMKPKEAARVFERLPQEVLVSVVTQMNSRKMSEVLAAMSPESAEKLTVALAKRGRSPAPDRIADPALPPGELPAIGPSSLAGPRS